MRSMFIRFADEKHVFKIADEKHAHLGLGLQSVDESLRVPTAAQSIDFAKIIL